MLLAQKFREGGEESSHYRRVACTRTINMLCVRMDEVV